MSPPLRWALSDTGLLVAGQLLLDEDGGGLVQMRLKWTASFQLSVWHSLSAPVLLSTVFPFYLKKQKLQKELFLKLRKQGFTAFQPPPPIIS